MLILARKSQESVVIAAADDLHELVRVTVVEVCGGKVKLGFEANSKIAIHREEVWERVCGEQETPTVKKVVERPKYSVPYLD